MNAMMMVMMVMLAAAEKPTTAVPMDSCVTAECHVAVKDYTIVHGPVNIDACDACHETDSAEQHTFKFVRPPQELCTFCHQMDLGDAPVVHEPLKTGDCLPCHDPHGGFDRFSLRGASMRDACFTCHDDFTADMRAVHGPVGAGACNVCHQAHTAEHENLLIATSRDLCVMCHTEMDEQLATVQFKHEAVEQDCGNCHDPHASPYPMQIRQPPLELCTSCHEPVKTAALEAKFPHEVVVEGDACLYCHTAHGGDMAALMRDKPVNFCLSCHTDDMRDDDGKLLVEGVADMLDPNKVKHGPVTDGMCGGCHNVHGSEYVSLLAKPYPEKFYAPFNVDNYELCFSCHDNQLVLTEQARGLTNFRNGDTNLHFVHVNKEKGRTCRSCHSTHASKFDVHIRESVPFGNWSLPINYSKTQDGGSCAPGCHQELAYDRENPVELPREDAP